MGNSLNRAPPQTGEIDITAHEIIVEARFKALTDAMSPKKRLRYLRRVSEILGDGVVVPCTAAALDTLRPVAEARAMWLRILPELMG